MSDRLAGVNAVVSAIVSTVVYALGGMDLALKTLLILIVLDYATGVLKAFFNGQVDSEIGAKGIIKKVGYLVIVTVAVLVDKNIGDTGAIRTLVIYFFVSNEGISILENWGGMGLKLPDQLMKALVELKQGTHEEDTDNDQR